MPLLSMQTPNGCKLLYCRFCIAFSLSNCFFPLGQGGRRVEY